MMKKTFKKMLALCVSTVMAVSTLSVSATAEKVSQNIMETSAITPRAALPSGAYYSTENPESFINIINTNGNTTCLFRIVYCNTTGGMDTICGTGHYDYRLNSSFQFVIDSWYYYDSNNTGYGTLYINATYSGGDIIIDATGETFSR